MDIVAYPIQHIIEKIMGRISDYEKIKFKGTLVNNTRYADDTVMFTLNMQDLASMASKILSDYSEEYCLPVKMMKFMKISKNNADVVVAMKP